MRLSTGQVFDRGITSMQDVQGQVSRTQEQISTQRRVLTPADDPVAATHILKVNEELSQAEQYQKNLVVFNNRSKLEEVTISNVANTMQRIRELTLQAGNGSMSAADRRLLAGEIRERIEQVANLMNTRDAANEYLFSGFQGGQKPFVKDGSGNYVYLGDEGRRYLQVASETALAVSDSGKELFVDIPSSNRTFYTEASPVNTAQPAASIARVGVLDQATFDAFYPEDAVIEFRPLTESTPPGLTNFTVRNRSDNQIIGGLQNVTYASGQDIIFQGIKLRINGAPAVGDAFFVQSSDKQGMLTTMEELSLNLETLTDVPADRATLETVLNTSLVNLDNVITRLSEFQGSLGARLSTAESVESLHEDFTLVSQKALSDLQDLDYGEAISRLSMQTMVLEAAQQSFSKIATLSLFNFLR